MSTSLKKLRLNQVEAALEAYRPFLGRATPKRGWVHEIRRALGMTEAQLGTSLGVAQSTIAELESREAKGTVSLNSLRRLAHALDCEVVYAIVPRKSLITMLQLRVREFARARMLRVAQTMKLEDQALPNEELDRQLEDLVQEFMEKPPRSIWD
jgi:predicted DNA-binding mobile mystery protein A